MVIVFNNVNIYITVINFQHVQTAPLFLKTQSSNVQKVGKREEKLASLIRRNLY